MLDLCCVYQFWKQETTVQACLLQWPALFRTMFAMFATGKDVCSCQPQHRSHPTLQLSWSEWNWGLFWKAIVVIYNSFMRCILVWAGDPNFEQNTENEENRKWANCPFDQCWFAGCSYNQHPDNKAACLAKRTRWDTSFRIWVLLPFTFPFKTLDNKRKRRSNLKSLKCPPTPMSGEISTHFFNSASSMQQLPAFLVGGGD